MIGDLPGYGTVWYHPDGIANILALCLVKKRFRVTFDSQGDDDSFIVHKPDGATRVFKESERGLYYLEVPVRPNGKHGTALVTTVKENKSKYTDRDYSKTVQARRIQRTIGRPSVREYVKIVEQNLLPNCPVTRADILAAEDIFGPDVGILKGKTTRTKANVVEQGATEVPPSIAERYTKQTIAIDIVTVRSLRFFVSVSRDLRFITAQHLPDKQSSSLQECARRIVTLYRSRGFTVTVIKGDGEFECLREGLPAGTQLNTVSEGEHVPEVERLNRTLKERVRCIDATLPFQRIPPRMTIEMVYNCVFWLNCFPPGRGLSATMSPRQIMTGQRIDFRKHCQLEYGSYVQTHDEHDNTMTQRTTGALAMRPTGNTQGGYWFYNLTTGRLINRRKWTELPMPNDVIERIHTAADAHNAPNIDHDDLNLHNEDFEDGDDPDDPTYDPDGHGDGYDAAGDYLDDNYYAPLAGVAGNDDADDPLTDEIDDADDPPTAGVANEEPNEAQEDDAAPETTEEIRGRPHGLRAPRPRSYNHIHPDSVVDATILAQYSECD
jgi:hypothetical protein